MTDEDIKDYCKNCDVEPPAMKFKCPECEHNPDSETNFVKDINVPYEEQIIIDGIDVSGCKYYLRNLHKICGVGLVDCQGKDCMFKQLARKTQKYELLVRTNKTHVDTLNQLNNKYVNLEQEREKLTNKNNLLIAELNQIKLLLEGKNTQYNVKVEEGEKYKKLAADFKDVNKQLGYKYLTIKQECEELKAEKEVIKKYLGISDKSIMQRLEELTEYKLKRQLKYIKIEEERDRYLKALEEIEDFRKKHCDFWCESNRILDIINKAKGEEKCQ